eukprot:TRINITY_DN13255_c0_g1_i2.p1 TRINITY_DN13255_c0_g1~~TRINITY_DN13255_c0_g1_i2.p1  ORF type:complete len:418 (+),score=91.91 TRINITY_DN13255_c0_g1_i2:272-1525(+)
MALGDSQLKGGRPRFILLFFIFLCGISFLFLKPDFFGHVLKTDSPLFLPRTERMAMEILNKVQRLEQESSKFQFVSGRVGELVERMDEIILKETEKSSSSLSGIQFNDNLMVLRQGHQSVRQLCTYSEEDLQGIFALQHHCSPHEMSYFYNGVWMNWQWLYNEIFYYKPKDPVVCVLVCSTDSPCKTTPCVYGYHLRRNSSDILVVRQLFENSEYSVVRPEWKFKSILDAGANVGIATAIFATKFPQARIVSVEASQHNYEILVKNVQHFSNVMPICAGLWSKVTSLSLVRGNRNIDLPPEWGFMVMESDKAPEGQAVESTLLGVSVPFLLKLAGLRAFDFLKIDIEGSELQLFTPSSSNNLHWAEMAKLVAVEPHNDMRPGSGDAVVNFYSERADKFEQLSEFTGEYIVYKNKNNM